ncbi:MAG TPA: 4Fe-4S dicluster domain-containing protein, partial [Deltaproteobacteria bacterium]|nr:4Fe-4S dicluster domain-containing protein [Deltaproteobacteria bacterium]
MKLIEKTKIKGVLAEWSKDFNVLCPSLTPNGDCLFDDFDPQTFTLEYRKPSMPQKRSCFPQAEKIFDVREGSFVPAYNHKKTVLFGIRACDHMGLRQSKSFFTRDIVDPFFGCRSEDTVIVVHACSWPQNETCFCTTVHSGPYATADFDIQLFDMGTDFLVEAGSDKGRRMISSSPFRDFDVDDAQERLERVKHMAFNSIPIVEEVAEAMDILKAGGANETVWEHLGRKCIACGGCVYVCPTCTCFTIHDRVTSKDSGERVRTWDTCLFEGFTKEASGHNPRPTQALRLKRRHEHKLLHYNPVDIQTALSGCVGCGRCSDSCPVHIGTLEVVKAITDHI